jgi:Tol biopolymer transport system component/DNA-binding winged helix-turn-helix (wHTH) protein
LAASAKIVRFGVFEVDLGRGELRKQGLRLKLQEQPFQVLAALLEQPGEIVSRDELVRRLWPDGTVVDYERGLNAAITRLRQTLSDSAETPRYVETVARRGYRFVAPVETPAVETTATPGPAPSPLPAERPKESNRFWAAAVAAGVVGGLVLATSIMVRRPAPITPPVWDAVPLTTDPGSERNPTFSPDGSLVAYEWDRGDGVPHIYIKTVGAGDAIRLTSGSEGEYGPAWSRDGQWIAFLRPEGESGIGVCVMPALGGTERRIFAYAAIEIPWLLRNSLRRIDWTPDGKRLVTGVWPRLGIISVETGEIQTLSEPKDRDSGDREPALSPDGRWLAYAREKLSISSDVYLLRLTEDGRADGEPQLLQREARSPAWSPDGKELIFSSQGQLFRMKINARGHDTAEPTGLRVSVATISQTGRLAYARPVIDNNIWRQEVPAAGKQAPPPVPLIDSTGNDQDGRYSPDGRRIAFQSNRSGGIQIWTCDSDGKRCSPLTAIKALTNTGTPRWSPDGKWIAFDSGAAGHWDVYVVDANGGAPRRITNDSVYGAIASWSGDGKWIYFMSVKTGRPEVWKVPAQGGAATQVTRNGGFVAFEAPDGQSLYYTKQETDSTLWRSALDGSGETEVVTGVANRGFALTKDRLYYLHGERDRGFTLRMRILATGAETEISRIVKPMYLGLSLSPDGKYLIYSQTDHEGSDLMLVDKFVPGIRRQ